MSDSSSEEEYLSPDQCELCERVMPIHHHHLYPKEEHKRLIKREKMDKKYLLSYTACVCNPCHSAIHRIFTNRQLADRYHTIEALVEDEDILNWIEYVRKQRTITKKQVLKGAKYQK